MRRQTSEISFPHVMHRKCDHCGEVKERGCFREAKSGKYRGMLRRWCKQCDYEADQERKAKRLAERGSNLREKRRAIKAYRNWAEAWRG